MSDTKTDTKITAAELRLQHTIHQQDSQIKDLTERLKATSAQLEAAIAAQKATEKTSDLRVSLTGTMIKAGVLPDAIADVVRRAEAAGEWETDPSGRVRRRDEHGRYHEDADEFLLTVKAKVPSYFEDSALTEDARSIGGNDASDSNGGSNGGGKAASTGAANPWSRDGWSDAAQIEAYRKDPVQAAAMAKAAGSRIGALSPT